MKKETKKNINILLPEGKFNTELSFDNIYMGDIYNCTEYKSSVDEAFKNGATDYEGFNKVNIQKQLYKKDAILVRLGNLKRPYYIELDNFSRLMISRKINIHENGSTTIVLDNIVLDEKPVCKNMLFVDNKSIRKVNLINDKLTDIIFNKNQKVKKIIKKKINEWNNINK